MILTADTALAAAQPAEDFFSGFKDRLIDVPGSRVFARIGGTGPALLLLHGYPQTSAMWHKIAPRLAQDYTVIAADLRGYGRSAKPAATPDHSAHSKRAMARDLIALMDALGFDRFLLGTHDRGARVGHRLAADHPSRVRALATLDIAPTREMYTYGGSDFAKAYWHWYWLIQPAPVPETMIGADPDFFWLAKCCRLTGAEPFCREALDEYLSAFRDPATIEGACEDYRAAASIDLEHDDADPGKLTMPLQALWGANGIINRYFDCLALWRQRAENVSGHGLEGGHYLAEEVPSQVLEHWIPFFADAPE